MNGEIRVRETGVVYRNPKPYLRSQMAFHPSVVRLSEREFVATFDLGQAVEALDYHTVIARSLDGGRTWAVEGPVLSSSPPSTTHTIRVSRLADGTLIGFGGWHHRRDPEAGLVNRETGGFVPVTLFLVRSFDGGRHWTEPEVLHPPLSSPAWEICHPIVELTTGRWLAPTATWRGWEGENPAGEQAIVLISDDRGRSWPMFGRTFDGRATGVSHLEQSVIQLQDGRILAICWVFDLRTGETFPTRYTLSSDCGETFLEPRPTGFWAETCKVTQLPDGRLLCVYRRHDRPGLWATVARLDAERWVNIAHALLWSGAPPGRGDRGADVLSGLTFGYPSLCPISAHEVLLLFWCQEECITHIRWIRIEIP
jgi:hypothetical protein